MGVGSVLLGKPWLYDFDVAQYGRANRCVLYFRGNKHIWQPYVPQTRADDPPATIPVDQSPPSQLLGLVSARQFIKGLENDAPMWAVQVRTKTMAAIANNYPAFLHEFADVFPIELPDSLPSDQAILHFLNFISSASLTNLPHY